MRRSKLLFIAIVATMIALVAGIYLGMQTSQTTNTTAPSLPEGGVARLFASSLDDSTGKPQAIAQWQGKTLVVNFWASWCPPCREEMPAFSRLNAKHAANGVQFVGIALDTPENVTKYAQQQPVSYPLLMAGSQGTELAQQLGNVSLALPYTVVLGPAGEVRLARLGRISEGELDALLSKTTRPQ